MTKLAIIGALALLAIPLSVRADPQREAEIKEALRVQQLICNAMADVRARGAGYADNNFSLCFIGLEELRAEYLQAADAGRVTAAAALAAARSGPARADGLR
ncbi:MAG: hypothetical protein JO032_02915 [Alphaproteobacteria bacterium]|nr:hypothetical protein [Alphaproteobacteria bacterium]MBV9551724.1 hypothetical protein [Alphaproteobacteria bacterium]